MLLGDEMSRKWGRKGSKNNNKNKMKADKTPKNSEVPVMFETLEPRILMSATPVIVPANTPPVTMVLSSSSRPAIVQDANGTQLTVSLTGQGTWQLTDGPNGLQLTVANTNANSQLVLSTAHTIAANSADHFLLNGIDLQGALGSVSGAGVDLQGSFKAENSLSAVTLGDAKPNSQFSFLGASATSQIHLGNVEDVTLAANAAIGSLAVKSWLSDGHGANQITGTSIGSLTSQGDFDASLSLSGTSSGVLPFNPIPSVPQSGPTLGPIPQEPSIPPSGGTLINTAPSLPELSSQIAAGLANGSTSASLNLFSQGSAGGFTLGFVSIGGQIGGGTWYVVGNTGVISAGKVSPQWDGDFTQSVLLVSTTGDFDGQIATPTLDNLIVGGNLSNALLLIGADLGADGKLAGTGANADHFTAGDAGFVFIGGSVSSSRIRIGVDPVDGVLDDGSNTIIGGTSSDIDQLTIGKSLDSVSTFVAGAFPKTISVGGKVINPLGNSDFHTAPIDVVPPSLVANVNAPVTNSPAITGTLTDAGGIGSFVASFDGQPVAQGTNILSALNANGNFTLNSALLATIAAGGTLADGPHTLNLLATDKSGNATTLTVGFRLDTQAPAVTVTGQPANVSNNNSPVIAGTVTAETGDAIKSVSAQLLAANGATTSPAVIFNSATGAFSIAPGKLADGSYTLTVTALDTLDNPAGTKTVTFTVDTQAPVVAITSQPAAVSNNKSPTIAGTVTAEAGDSIKSVTAQLAVAGGATTTVPVTLNANGTFSIAPSTLADGAYTLTVTALDTLDNPAGTKTVTFTVDTQAPVVSITSQPAAVSNNKSPTIAGTVTAEAGDSIKSITAQLAVAGGATTTVPVTLNANGTFSIAPSTLADGAYTLTVAALDTGNLAGTKTISFTIDTQAPVVTIASQPAAVSNNKSPTIAGTVTTETGDSIQSVTAQLTVTGGATTTPAVTFNNTTGTFSIAPGTLADGSYTLTVTALDTLGNPAGTKTISFTIDAQAPVVSITSQPAAASNNASPTVTGTVTAEAGDSIKSVTAQLAVAGGATTTVPVTLNADGTFSIAPGATTPLPDGIYLLTVTAQDTLGNAAGMQTVTFAIDNQAPNLAAALQSAGPNNLTNNPTIAGSASATEAGDSLKNVTAQFVDANGNPIGSTLTVTPAANGQFTLTSAQLAGLLSEPKLADGNYTVQLTALDAASNSTQATVSFTLNTQPPVVTAKLADVTGASTGANASLTSNATIVGTIQAVNGFASILASFDGVPAAKGQNIAFDVNLDGTFSISPQDQAFIAGQLLTDGAHTLHLLVTDNAGNTTTQDVSFTLGTQAPTITAALVGGVGSGASQLTTSSTATIAGTVATENKLVSLTGEFAGALSSFDLTSQVNADGTFTLSPAQLASIAGHSLTDGVHSFELQATDAAGLVTQFTVSFTTGTLSAALTHDTGAANGHPGFTSDATVNGAVSISNGLTSLTAGFDGAPAKTFDLTGFVNANDGTFMLTPAQLASIAGGPLADGAHTLHLLATEGNGTTKALDLSFTLVTKAPTLSAALADAKAVNSDGSTQDDTIAGTVNSVAPIVSLQGGLDGTSVANFTDLSKSIGANGAFTLSPTELQLVFGSTIPNGAHTLTLIATDAAGNESTVNVSFNLNVTRPVFTLDRKSV